MTNKMIANNKEIVMRKLVLTLIIVLPLFFMVGINEGEQPKKDMEIDCSKYLIELMGKNTYQHYRPIYVNGEDFSKQKLENNGFTHEEGLVFARGHYGKLVFDFNLQEVRSYLGYGKELMALFSFKEIRTQNFIAGQEKDLEYLAYEVKRLLIDYSNELSKLSCSYLTGGKIYQEKTPVTKEWFQVSVNKKEITEDERFKKFKDWKEASTVKLFDQRLITNKGFDSSQFYVYWTNSEYPDSYYDDKKMYGSRFIWATDDLINNVIINIIDTPIFVVDLAFEKDLNLASDSADYLNLKAVANSLHLFANPNEEGYFTHVGSYYSYETISAEFRRHIELFYDNDYREFDRHILTEFGYQIFSNTRELSLIGVY